MIIHAYVKQDKVKTTTEFREGGIFFLPNVTQGDFLKTIRHLLDTKNVWLLAGGSIQSLVSGVKHLKNREWMESMRP